MRKLGNYDSSERTLALGALEEKARLKLDTSRDKWLALAQSIKPFDSKADQAVINECKRLRAEFRLAEVEHDRLMRELEESSAKDAQ